MTVDWEMVRQGALILLGFAGVWTIIFAPIVWALSKGWRR